jgi:hypothetical protein
VYLMVVLLGTAPTLYVPNPTNGMSTPATTAYVRARGEVCESTLDITAMSCLERVAGERVVCLACAFDSRAKKRVWAARAAC